MCNCEANIHVLVMTTSSVNIKQSVRKVIKIFMCVFSYWRPVLFSHIFVFILFSDVLLSIIFIITCCVPIQWLHSVLWTLECIYLPWISIVFLFNSMESCTLRWQHDSLLEHTEMCDIMSEQPELLQSYQYIPWHSNVSRALHLDISHSGYCTETRLASI
jgi:hypothetical protein